MQAIIQTPSSDRYARCVEVSRRVRFDIERDVIRGRSFDFTKKFLPDGLSRIADLPFLSATEQTFFSQIQGRTYANMFGLVERFIGAQMLDISRDHSLGDQSALEALVRFTDEEIKHQEMFRRLDRMAAAGMPEGYTFVPEPNTVAQAVLAASDWAVLALICHIEIFVLAHYHSSIEPDDGLSQLWKDVFLHHAREESQHAIIDELEWIREDAKLDAAQRDTAVNDLIALVGAVDGILVAQAEADARYFAAASGRPLSDHERSAVGNAFRRAYRYQYIVTGVQDGRFLNALGSLVTDPQAQRIGEALLPVIADVEARTH